MLRKNTGKSYFMLRNLQFFCKMGLAPGRPGSTAAAGAATADAMIPKVLALRQLHVKMSALVPSLGLGYQRRPGLQR